MLFHVGLRLRQKIFAKAIFVFHVNDGLLCACNTLGAASGGILYRFVGRDVLDVLGVHGFRTVRRHEDLDRFIVIADGVLVERTLDALTRAMKIMILPCPGRPAAINKTRR